MDLMGYSYKMLLLFSGNMGGNAAFMYVSLLKNPIEGVNWCQRYLSVAAVDNIVRPEIQPTEKLEHQRKSMPTLFLRFQWPQMTSLLQKHSKLKLKTSNKRKRCRRRLIVGIVDSSWCTFSGLSGCKCFVPGVSQVSTSNNIVNCLFIMLKNNTNCVLICCNLFMKVSTVCIM